MMEYRSLGRAGLKVSALCLGTMTFGTAGKRYQPINGVDQALANAMVGRALEAGINYFDTADTYSEGDSERMLGKAICDLGVKRSDVVIATKFFNAMGPGPNNRGASRAHVMSAVRASLERLGLDYVDHYQVHQFDPSTPMEETLRALDDLVRDGLVRYTGVSNWSAWQCMKAVGICSQRGWVRPESVQSYYSLVGRDVEDELVPMLSDQSLGMTVWSPLASGYLSDRMTGGGTADAPRWAKIRFPPVDETLGARVLAVLREIAPRYDATVAQIALAWVMARPVVCSVLIGARSMGQLEDNLAAAAIRLDAADMARLDEVSQPAVRYPGWMSLVQRRASDG